MNSLIIKAIKERRLIQVYYDGGTRTIEPHCYGVSKAGKELLRLYQVGGYSSSNSYDWKLFTVEKMNSIKILNETFDSPRYGYKRNDSVMRRIYAQL